MFFVVLKLPILQVECSFLYVKAIYTRKDEIVTRRHPHPSRTPTLRYRLPYSILLFDKTKLQEYIYVCFEVYLISMIVQYTIVPRMSKTKLRQHL